MLKFFSRPSFLFLPFSFIFILACYRYSTHLNLWGDEVFSLLLSHKPIAKIFTIVDVHSPYYYFLVKLMVNLLGDSYHMENFIRLIHSVIFCGGLYFGFKLLQLFYHDTLIIFFTLIFTAITPSYIFYATNIRMYSPLFLFSMWFLYSIIRYLDQQELLSLKHNWELPVVGFCLIATDFIGGIYYTIGFLFVLLKNNNFKKPVTWLWIMLPPLLLMLSIFSLIAPTLHNLLSWPGQSCGNFTGNYFKVFLMKVLNSGRVFAELTNILYSNIYLPFINLLLFGIFLLIGAFFWIKKYFETKDLKLGLVLSLTFCWLPLCFIGCSISRLFLPSQFFLAVLILYGLFSSFHQNILRIVLFFVLISFNLYSLLFPLPRFNSLIPYREIATTTLNWSEKLNVNTILISGYSLSYESVKRYLSLNDSNHHLIVKPLNEHLKNQDIPKHKFLFLSYMGENKHFIDVKKFSNEFNKKVYVVDNFVNLRELPFNKSCKKILLDRACQDHAFELYLVE